MSRAQHTAPLAAAMVACVLTTIAPDIAAGACPLNAISITSTGMSRQSAASSDSLDGASTHCELECNHVAGTASYDLATGSCACYAYATADADEVSSVSTRDVFTLVGPAGSPPITFFLTAHVRGDAAAPGSSATATVREGSSQIAASAWGPGSDHGARDLTFAVTRAAGQTFEVAMEGVASRSVSGGPAGSCFVRVQLGFPNLPSGYSVVSCQGFTTLLPTAAQRANWRHGREFNR